MPQHLAIVDAAYAPRRRFLGTLCGWLTLGSGTRVAAAGPRAKPPGQPTFVLVHGAWHGGWCWQGVAARLRAGGYVVHTPTLTGLGERAHLLNPTVGLGTHVDDVAATIVCEELENIVLVGHSYAGMVIGGVADRLRERLRRLVFLDTLIPVGGQSLAQAADLSLANLRARSPDGISAPVPPLSTFGVSEGTSEARWLARRLTPHPIAAFAEPLEFHRAGIEGINSTYIRCTSFPLKLTGYYMRVAQAKGWPVRSIETGHDAMVTAPGRLAELLAAEAARD